MIAGFGSTVASAAASSSWGQQHTAIMKGQQQQSAEGNDDDYKTKKEPSGGEHHQPTSALYDWVNRNNRHRSLLQVQNRPIDARYVSADERRETPLALACRKSPSVRLVKALLEAWRDAVRVFNGDGELPIHVACRHNASIEVLKELVTGGGDDDSRAGTAEATTTAPTGSANKQPGGSQGKNSLQILWESREPINTSRSDGTENYNSVFWQKFRVLLEAVAIHRDFRGPDCGEWLVLHAALSLGSNQCPMEVLEYALVHHREQILLSDARTGRLPLHIAVGPKTAWLDCVTAGPKHQPPDRRIVARMLRYYPESVRVRIATTGRLPLHEAIANGHRWQGGVRDLFAAAPELLAQRDPVSGLHPFQLAAAIQMTDSINTGGDDDGVGDDGEEDTDLESIYGLLRALPGAIVHQGDDALSAAAAAATSSQESKTSGLYHDAAYDVAANDGDMLRIKAQRRSARKNNLS